MQSNRAQAAEHARDERGKGQPQQEAKRKRTETRRTLRAIRGKIRGRTSMRRHRKKGFACCVLCVGLRLHNPREPRRKPWRKPDGNRSEIGGDKADLILRPRFLRLSNGGQRENPVSDGNTSLAHGVGASTLGFHALVRCAPNHPHPLSWKGTPPCARRTLCKVAAGRRHPIRKDQR